MSDLPAIKYLDMAARDAGSRGWVEITSNIFLETRKSIIAHARALEEADRLREALAKYEPEPVDEDVDEAALLRIVNAWMGSERTLDLRRGSYATDWANALAQYKAERPTITDDEALLIAREICARLLPGWCAEYHEGLLDGGEAFQFALAMVKRDPAALEAFRGVGRG